MNNFAQLAKSLTRAKKAEQVANADTVLAKLEELQTWAWRLCDQAEPAKDHRTAIRGAS